MPNEMAEPVTAEGEQVILSQQLARFLIKELRRVRAGSEPLGQVSYLKGGVDMAPLRMGTYKGATQQMMALIRYRAALFAQKLEASFSKAEKPGLTFEATLNEVAVLAWKAAECHSWYAFLENNQMALQNYVQEEGLKAVLGQLLELACLQLVRENGGDFVDVLDGKQLDLILDRINTILTELRPDAVSLVDAFGFTDSQLNSTLGRYDGAVYEAIYEEAKKSPLNQSNAMVGWEHLSQVLDLDFLREGMKIQRAGAPGAAMHTVAGPAFAIAPVAAAKL
jgi:acyl-CoA oxidase